MAGETFVTVIGNLTADPELRVTPSGYTVCNVNIASNTRRYDRDRQEWVEDSTLYIAGTMWRDLAEHCVDSLHRGDRVLAYGTLRQETWEDKETGKKRSATVMDVQEIGPSLRYATARLVRAARASDAAREPGRPAPAHAEPDAVAPF